MIKLKNGDAIKIVKMTGWQQEKQYGVELNKKYIVFDVTDKGRGFAIKTKTHPIGVYFSITEDNVIIKKWKGETLKEFLE
jgi:hypothetical protein